jgi:hypothetical protein
LQPPFGWAISLLKTIYHLKEVSLSTIWQYGPIFKDELALQDLNLE